jgi:hypothetical protein
MGVRPPKLLWRPPPKPAVDLLGDEILAEKAATLGRLYHRLETALAALALAPDEELAAALTGENVSFRFVGPKAGFRFAETAIVSLGAPKEGPMAGFLFYRDPGPQPGDFVIGTDLATKLLGTTYLPGATLSVDVIGLVAAQSAYTVIVADRIDIRGAELVVNSDYGATDIPVPRGVGPTGGKVTLTK